MVTTWLRHSRMDFEWILWMKPHLPLRHANFESCINFISRFIPFQRPLLGSVAWGKGSWRLAQLCSSTAPCIGWHLIRITFSGKHAVRSSTRYRVTARENEITKRFAPHLKLRSPWGGSHAIKQNFLRGSLSPRYSARGTRSLWSISEWCCRERGAKVTFWIHRKLFIRYTFVPKEICLINSSGLQMTPYLPSMD